LCYKLTRWYIYCASIARLYRGWHDIFPIDNTFCNYEYDDVQHSQLNLSLALINVIITHTDIHNKWTCLLINTWRLNRNTSGRCERTSIDYTVLPQWYNNLIILFRNRDLISQLAQRPEVKPPEQWKKNNLYVT